MRKHSQPALEVANCNARRDKLMSTAAIRAMAPSNVAPAHSE